MLLNPLQALRTLMSLSGKCKKIVEPRIMQNRFKAYLAEGKIEEANFHSLRHTFATRCIEAGFDVKTLSRNIRSFKRKNYT